MKKLILQVSLVSLVGFHFLLVGLNLASLFVLPFVEPWYIAAPLVTFLGNLLFTQIACPLTRLENWLRITLGLSGIKSFIGHYIVSPIKRRIRSRKEDVEIELGITQV